MVSPAAFFEHRSDGGVGTGVLLRMSGVNQRARIIGDKYEVERHLATGGMGELYVARHVLTTQRVAVKVLDRRLARSDASIERFLREVRLGAKIGHPAVVQVFDAGLHVGPDGPVPYLAMELLEGQNVAERIVRGDVTQAMALEYIVALLEPLAMAHAKGVVHRDLKPENAFLERLPDGSERVRLLDLGIAREAADVGHVTLDGQALGTVYYMAPEQSLDARSATPASDVWSLGAMLYQALAGVFPFDGDSVAAVLVRACRDPHVPLREAAPHVDPRLADLVDRCLSKSMLDRPGDASALLAELAPLLADLAVHRALDAQLVTTWTFQSAEPVRREDPFSTTADASPVSPNLPSPAAPTHESGPTVDLVAAVRASAAPKRVVATPPQLDAQAPAATPATKPRSRLPWILAAAALPLCVGVWFALHRPASRAAPRATRAPIEARVTTPIAPPSPPPTVTPSPEVMPVAEPPRAPEVIVAAAATGRPDPRLRRPRTASEATPAQSPSTVAQPPTPTEPPIPAPLPEPSFEAPRVAVVAPPPPAPVVAPPPAPTPVVARPAAPVAAPPLPTAPTPPRPDFVTF